MLRLKVGEKNSTFLVYSLSPQQEVRDGHPMLGPVWKYELEGVGPKSGIGLSQFRINCLVNFRNWKQKWVLSFALK